jgi:hypothetical protein
MIDVTYVDSVDETAILVLKTFPQLLARMLATSIISFTYLWFR